MTSTSIRFRPLFDRMQAALKIIGYGNIGYKTRLFDDEAIRPRQVAMDLYLTSTTITYYGLDSLENSGISLLVLLIGYKNGYTIIHQQINMYILI